MTTSDSEMDEYPSLRSYTRALYVLGMVLYALAVLCVAGMLLMAMVPLLSNEPDYPALLMSALGLLASAIFMAVFAGGLFICRELLIVFVRIERNTR